MVRCLEHAKTFLMARGYKVKGVYWVESAGDSREGLDTIGYVNLSGELKRAFLEFDPRSTERHPNWLVKRTEAGW